MFHQFEVPPLPVADRDVYDGAINLIASFGAAADIEAAMRADASRDRGNVQQFARWRQIERLIPVLVGDEVIGTLQ